MLERLEALSNIYGVSGNETRVRKYIREIVAPLADEVYTDAMGNLYAHKKGTGPKIMACAHMDEVGMLVIGIDDNGMLRYDDAGLDSRVVVSKRVVVGKDDVPGIIGSKAIHLQSREEFETALKHDQLAVDIGAKDKADAEKYVHIGDYISFATKFSRFGDGLVAGKALDDRVGCAMLIELLKDSYDCDFYAVFTTMEEIGCRGAMAAAFNVAPDLALVLEGTTANDMPEVRSHQSVTNVGDGPAITLMDGMTVALPRMFSALKETAKAAGIKWQLRKGTRGGTDGGAIHKAMAGCPVGGISVPCRFIHSPCSVASISDIEGAYTLAHEFLKTKKFSEVLANE